ncbi:MAG: thioredoxin domain-containing protein, partial [Gluconacetobacter diazotrophicus]|nr:thioredoxin domain-containing protein [Gluconacetobacter diazotrophicus]
FDVQAGGNAPAGSDPQGEFAGKNILFARPGDAAAEREPVLAQARRKLLAVRDRRPRPHLDDKVLTAWNGLMISAYARAFQVLGNPDDLQAAGRAAAFIRQNLYRESDGVLLRSYRQGSGTVEGFADDYAFLIQALLDLYEANADAEHLRWAERLQGKQDELFADPAGGYFSTSAQDRSVLLRLKEDNDNAEPAASSVAALNLTRLADLAGRDTYRQQAERTVTAFSAAQNPLRTAQAMPLMLCALDFLADPPRQIVVVGPHDRADTRAMVAAVHRHFVPNKVVLLADGDAGLRALAGAHPYLENATMVDGKATAYLCEGGACQLPTTDPEALARRLANQKGA